MSQTTKPTFYFEVLAGKHCEPIPGNKEVLGISVSQGEVFQSPFPHYADKWPEKFKQVHADELASYKRRGKEVVIPGVTQRNAPSTPLTQEERGKMLNFTVSDLDRMNLQQLKDLASEEEIPLGQAKSREEVLKAVKQAFGSPATSAA